MIIYFYREMQKFSAVLCKEGFAKSGEYMRLWGRTGLRLAMSKKIITGYYGLDIFQARFLQMIG
jgi:hypothetical protein